MTLKDRILKVITKSNKSYLDLCKELKLSEKELDELIELEDIRIFEKISKLIRVPLYTFYRKKNSKDPETKRYYDQDLWEDD